MTDNQSDPTYDVTDEVPDATEVTDAHDELDDAVVERGERISAKEFGDIAAKFASETAFAAAGLANLVAEKAREFTDKQRAALADAAGDAAPVDQTKAFLDQVSAQMNKLVEELGHTYKDLADRGRDAVAKMQAQAAARPDPKDAPGMFDIVEGAETAEPANTVAENDVVDIEVLDEVDFVADESADKKADES